MKATLQQKRPIEETARLGEEIYARLTKTVFRPEDHRKYAAIAVNSGNFEIDSTIVTAVDRMKAREPQADIWIVKIGEPAVGRMRTPR